ncbi:MAG: hypothetical protein ACTSRW_12300 [Candidatus Helarchaeota archaeon]
MKAFLVTKKWLHQKKVVGNIVSLLSCSIVVQLDDHEPEELWTLEKYNKVFGRSHRSGAWLTIIDSKEF